MKNGLLLCAMEQHQIYMRRCIDLAALGLGRVSPNPMVGAVIVHKGQIIGEGYHHEYGKPHAEVNAVADAERRYPDAAARFKESTIYVSLEPCSHFGKTPPCTDLIISKGIRQVVIGSGDPFEQVNGKGIEKLKNAGIEVIQGILERECAWQNRRFFTRVQKQRPYIILKWAETSDGYFAPPGASQKWISGAEARKLVHKWRSEEDAVLVGTQTAWTDDPQLNVREWTGRNPLRAVIDRNLRLPASLKLFDGSQQTVVFNALKNTTENNIIYTRLDDFEHYLPQLIAYQLYLMDIQSLIVEGGAKTLQLFIRAGLWDEARVFTAPLNWGEGIPAPGMGREAFSESHVGKDTLRTFINPNA